MEVYPKHEKIKNGNHFKTREEETEKYVGEGEEGVGKEFPNTGESSFKKTGENKLNFAILLIINN